MMWLCHSAGVPARSVGAAESARIRRLWATPIGMSESFTGRYEKVGSVAGAAPAPGLDIDFSTVDWGQAADRWTFGQVGSDSHTVVALLQGNRGRTIRCRFTLLYAAGGMQDGGTGQCEVDTGERIDVRF